MLLKTQHVVAFVSSNSSHVACFYTLNSSVTFAQALNCLVLLVDYSRCNSMIERIVP